MKKKTEKLDAFFNIFMGEVVKIVTTINTTEYINTEEGPTEQTSPIILKGYLMDYDDEYYFISENADEVACAIKKDKVALIEIQKEYNVYEDILDDLAIPTKKEDIN